MNETLTIPQVLEVTIRILGDINVPMNLFNAVGAPINAAINNLRACADAIQRNNEETKEVSADE